MLTTKGSWQLLAGVSGSEAFTGSGSYEELFRLAVGGLKTLQFSGIVGGTTLTGLKTTKAIAAGQTHVGMFTDADFDVPFNKLPSSSKTAAGTSLYLTAAGSRFEFELDVSNLTEVSVWVKSGGAGTITYAVSACDK